MIFFGVSVVKKDKRMQFNLGGNSYHHHQGDYQNVGDYSKAQRKYYTI